MAQFSSSASKKLVPTKDPALTKEPVSEAVAPQVATVTNPLPQTTPIVNGSAGKEIKSGEKNNKSRREKTGGSGKCRPICQKMHLRTGIFVGRPSQGGATAAPLDVSRLDFRIGRVVSAKKHPDADSLYVEEGECRTWTQSTY